MAMSFIQSNAASRSLIRDDALPSELIRYFKGERDCLRRVERMPRTLSFACKKETAISNETK